MIYIGNIEILTAKSAIYLGNVGLEGFQIDSKDKNAMTIARILKCNERTVRNRRDRAFETLKPILEAEFSS